MNSKSNHLNSQGQKQTVEQNIRTDYILKIVKLDWYSMKLYHKRAFLVPLLGFFMGIFDPMFFIYGSVLAFAIFSINPFAVEDKGELNKFYLTLPIGRSTMVMGRYVFSGIMAGLGLLFGMILFIIYNLFFHYTINLDKFLKIFADSFLLFSIINLSSYPILYKMGYLKGKFIGLGIICILTNFMSALAWNTYYNGITQMVIKINNSVMIGILEIIIAVLIIALSYLISMVTYSRRDF